MQIRQANPGDVPRLAALLSDMQAHYGSPDPPGGAAAMARLMTRPGERLPFALLAAAARIALEQGYCRIDWTTDGRNDGAQRLYDRLGVPRQDKRFYRLSGEHLAKLAQR